MRRVGVVMAAVLALWSLPAWAGGGLTAGDVPAAPTGTSSAPVAAAASSQGVEGCLPFEARYRAIPPRPRISASALLTHGTP